jgi:hypothetical protein
MSHIATKGRGPGQYWPVEGDGKRYAVFYCPTCGQGMHLNNHEINPRGVVQPSVVEPANPFPACPVVRCGTFHDHLILADWPTPKDLQICAENLEAYYQDTALLSAPESKPVCEWCGGTGRVAWSAGGQSKLDVCECAAPENKEKNKL